MDGSCGLAVVREIVLAAGTLRLLQLLPPSMDRRSDRLPILVGDVVVVVVALAVEAEVTDALLLLPWAWFRRDLDLARCCRRCRGDAFSLSPVLSRLQSNEAIMTAGG
jgi:hypothetical protein